MTDRVERIIEALKGHPQVLWDLTIALRKVHIAGPWKQHGSGNTEKWIRYNLGGHTVVSIELVQGSPRTWLGSDAREPGVPEHIAAVSSFEAGREMLDEYLRKREWLLL